MEIFYILTMHNFENLIMEKSCVPYQNFDLVNLQFSPEYHNLARGGEKQRKGGDDARRRGREVER